MTDELDMISFGIIADASDARTLAMNAFSAAVRGELKDSREMLAQSRQILEKARRSQTDILFEEMNGKEKTVNVLLVHSQDHLTSAAAMLDMVELMLPVIEEQQSLKAKVDALEKKNECA